MNKTKFQTIKRFQRFGKNLDILEYITRSSQLASGKTKRMEECNEEWWKDKEGLELKFESENE